MIGTELLNIFEKYHIDAGQSKQVEQILKEQNLLETLRTVTPMEKGMTNRSFLATGDQKYLIRFPERVQAILLTESRRQMYIIS